MEHRRPLAEAWRKLRPAPHDATPDDALELTLAHALTAARAASLPLPLSDDDFIRHLAATLPAGDNSSLSSLHVADLFLARACLARAPHALAALDQRLDEVPAFLSRLSPTPTEIDEVRQRLRERLLVGERPRLAEYSGRGALSSWLRVAAVRIFSNLRREELPRQRAELEAAAVLPYVDPELGYIKQRYAADFRRALHDAFAALEPRDRTLLRLKLLDRLNIEKIGALHGVHRATVARWLDDALARVLAETRRLLHERLRVSPDELQSLYDLVSSQLEISLDQLLRSAR